MATNGPPSAHLTNSWHEDEIVEHLHRHRAELAERFGYSLEELYEYYSSISIEPAIPIADIAPVVPKHQPK